ncbi:unnamed protein product [marine sediment metagenome]|uniref:Uncharacterized protein n=1 Tax=marine sediment metagenome TaxID=412755 RepID=X1L8H6_9ZZZZ
MGHINFEYIFSSPPFLTLPYTGGSRTSSKLEVKDRLYTQGSRVVNIEVRS